MSELGTDVNAKSKYDIMTLLQHATDVKNNVYSLKCIPKQMWKTKKCSTPLHYTYASKKIQRTTRFLIEHSAKINATNRIGETHSFIAVIYKIPIKFSFLKIKVQ